METDDTAFPLVAVSPLVVHTLPVCLQLDLLADILDTGSRWFLAISLYRETHDNITIVVLGQISQTEGEGYRQNQITLPAGTYRLLLSSHNNDLVQVYLTGITVKDGECVDNGEWFVYVNIWMVLSDACHVNIFHFENKFLKYKWVGKVNI